MLRAGSLVAATSNRLCRNSICSSTQPSPLIFRKKTPQASPESIVPFSPDLKTPIPCGNTSILSHRPNCTSSTPNLSTTSSLFVAPLISSHNFSIVLPHSCASISFAQTVTAACFSCSSILNTSFTTSAPTLCNTDLRTSRCRSVSGGGSKSRSRRSNQKAAATVAPSKITNAINPPLRTQQTHHSPQRTAIQNLVQNRVLPLRLPFNAKNADAIS